MKKLRLFVDLNLGLPGNVPAFFEFSFDRYRSEPFLQVFRIVAMCLKNGITASSSALIFNGPALCNILYS